MRRTAVLNLSLSGPDPEAIARGLDDIGWLPQKPDKLEVDYEKRKPQPGWIAVLGKAARKVVAMSNEGHTLTFTKKGLVTLRRPDTELAAPETFALLTELPFELAAIGQIYPEWWDEEYPTYSFSDGHVQHGWACAFKGAGYDRLVSRRWLDFGPWRKRVIGAASWIEFHDLEADPKQALEQALPGWERMGISDTGGFIQSGFVFKDDVGGVYDADQHKLKILVQSGEVSQRKMLEIAAARHNPLIQKAYNVEHTAFIFTDEANAKRHLHELWLREHECWAIVEGDERRLDTGYTPQPSPPAWARS
jgi:hypothetical protein